MTQESERESMPPMSPVEVGAFRNGMSRLAAAVQIIATDGPAGKSGMTVTAVTSVTDAPATLLVCVNASSHFCRVVEANGVFSINLLTRADQPVAEAFGGPTRLPPETRFSVGTWAVGLTGAPLLASAMVSFDCRLSGSDTIATHRVLMGAVVDMRLGPKSDALLYWERGYRGLSENE